MDKKYSTIGYGFHLEETILLLDFAIKSKNQEVVRNSCINSWPQKSVANKERIWRHLKYRFLEIENDTILKNEFLKMYEKVGDDNKAVIDLIFFQLCITTPILTESLALLVTDSFMNTGQAVFSKYHLNQLMEDRYGELPKSTRDRILSILVKSGRLIKDKDNFKVQAMAPTESILGYVMYFDSVRNGWRAPSTSTIINQSIIAPIFLCNRSLLIAGVDKLSAKGHCEYHRHGQTDQVQLTHQTLEEYVDAWK